MKKPRTKKPRQRKPEHAPEPVRVQISTSDGSEVAAALGLARDHIPPELQKHFNLGGFFRQVLQENDAAIAQMIMRAIAEKT